MEQESWRRNHGGRIMEEESWSRNHGGGIILEAIREEESWRRHHGRNPDREGHQGGLMGEESWMRNHEMESTGRHPAGTSTKQRLPRGSQKAPRRHPGGTQEAPMKRHETHPKFHHVVGFPSYSWGTRQKQTARRVHSPSTRRNIVYRAWWLVFHFGTPRNIVYPLSISGHWLAVSL